MPHMPKEKRPQQAGKQLVGVSTTISAQSDAFFERLAQKEDRSKAAILRRILERHAVRQGRGAAA